jgi:hypothetical protein
VKIPPACPYLGENEIKPDAHGVKRCQDEIKSGRYHAIVVVDYSNREEFQEFEEAFGALLQQFVAAGGVVAFPSSEAMLVSTVEKYFDTEWKMSNYYRTTWGPCLKDNERNINYSFGNGNLSRRVIKEYSAKGNTLNVPRHERCFGVTENSRKDVCEEDAIVAMHNYGKGAIAYFGDVNASHETIWLVAAFVESRSPTIPIDCFSSIEASVFAEIIQLKGVGNDSFKAGDLDTALGSYQSALNKFETKMGINGSQRECYIALLSNMSLIYYKNGFYCQSEGLATKVLDIEWGQEKCSYRRAMARLKISQTTAGGDLVLLRKAEKDVLNAGMTPPSTLKATQKLMAQIESEIKRLKKKEEKKFSAGFENAMNGK